MKRFVEEQDRMQATLFPERLDDYISPENPIRVIDAFVEKLDLEAIGFARVNPKVTGRPGYHPSTLLKLYIYGYLNRIQSSRRLERESLRNVELMWLIGRLAPDFKTIADFRKENGKAIRQVCREFVEICRRLELFTQSMVAIDGSKFKAVNSRRNNDTKNVMKRHIDRVNKTIDKYLKLLDEADSGDLRKQEHSVPALKEKLASLNEEMARLKEREKAVLATPDKQISRTDPDSRLLQKGRMGMLVGYNVQSAVDTKNKLIVAHDVTNAISDRSQLAPTTELVQAALKKNDITVLADRGYYSGVGINECYETGAKALVPKNYTSTNKAAGLYDKADFNYDKERDIYVCPAGQVLQFRGKFLDRGVKVNSYYALPTVCAACQLKTKCTTGKERRVRRREHDDLLESMDKELNETPDAMVVRAQTVEHPFGTIKTWMGRQHFLMKRLPNVRTEMSLHVLAYNLKRVMSILGVAALIEVI